MGSQQGRAFAHLLKRLKQKKKKKEVPEIRNYVISEMLTDTFVRSVPFIHSQSFIYWKG